MSTAADDFVIDTYARGTNCPGAKGPWYVTLAPGKFYLHRDGEWRRSTAVDMRNIGGSSFLDYRGYFATQQEARAALDAALATGNVPLRGEG